MSYLTLERFLALGGDEALSDSFGQLEARARQVIDRATHGRLADAASLPESVEMTALELIQCMAADQRADAADDGRSIASVTNDGLSIHYATGDPKQSAVAARQARYMDIVRAWLAGEISADGTQLLYCGVDAG